MLFGDKLFQGNGYAGQVDAPINHEFTHVRTNPAKAQKGTITVGGTAEDGIYSITITNPAEPTWPGVYVEFDRQDSETNAQIAAALNSKLNTSGFVLKAIVTVNSAVITVEARNTDVLYSVVTVAPGAATLVWAQTVAPGGVVVPFGRFVAGDGTGFGMRPLESGDVIANVIGVTIREMNVENVETVDGFDGVKIGYEAPIAGKGPIKVDCEEAMTPADAPFIRIVASGSNTMIGCIAKTADGGNCIAATTICKILENSADGVVRVGHFIPMPTP
jgi:hypothetical protein